MYAIVATLFKFRSRLRNSPIRVQVLSDHESLQQWHTGSLNTMAGPIGRRGSWHQFFSTFDIEVIYVKGSYPAVQAAPDVSIDGTEADLAGRERDELEEKEWADSELQLSRRVRPFVDVLRGGKSARSRGLKRKAHALCGHFHRQGWFPSAMAESTVHTPDALLFPDLPVSSLRTGKATDRGCRCLDSVR